MVSSLWFSKLIFANALVKISCFQKLFCRCWVSFLPWQKARHDKKLDLKILKLRGLLIVQIFLHWTFSKPFRIFLSHSTMWLIHAPLDWLARIAWADHASIVLHEFNAMHNPCKLFIGQITHEHICGAFITLYGLRFAFYDLLSLKPKYKAYNRPSFLDLLIFRFNVWMLIDLFYRIINTSRLKLFICLYWSSSMPNLFLSSSKLICGVLLPALRQRTIISYKRFA